MFALFFSIRVNRYHATQDKVDTATKSAVYAASRGKSSYEVAVHVAREMGNAYGGHWNCISGQFAASFTYNPGNLIQFDIGNDNVTLFRNDIVGPAKER